MFDSNQMTTKTSVVHGVTFNLSRAYSTTKRNTRSDFVPFSVDGVIRGGVKHNPVPIRHKNRNQAGMNERQRKTCFFGLSVIQCTVESSVECFVTYISLSANVITQYEIPMSQNPTPEPFCLFISIIAIGMLKVTMLTTQPINPCRRKWGGERKEKEKNSSQIVQI